MEDTLHSSIEERLNSDLFNWTEWRPVEYHRNGVPMQGRSCPITDSNSWILNRKYSNSLARLAISTVKVGRAGSKKQKISGTWYLLQRRPLPMREFKRYESRVAESVRASLEVEIPAPEGFEYRAYQKAGIAYSLGTERNVLIADDMGLGKTIQAVGLLNAQKWGGPVLIVCPASLKINWQRELEKWLIHPVSIARAYGSKLPNTDVVIINYEILNRNAVELKRRQWQCLIGDEIHISSNLQLPRNRLIHFEINALRRVYLTGTPFTTDFYKAWPLFHALDWMSFPCRFEFAKRYCDAKLVHNGYCKSWDFTGSSHTTELNHALRRAFMVRRLKVDVLDELPRKSRQILELSVQKQLGQLLAEEKKIIPELESVKTRIEELERCDRMEELAEAIKNLQAKRDELESRVKPLRQEIGLRKVPMVIQHLKDMDLNSVKVVVFGYHRKVLERIVESFGERAVLFYGGMGETQRQAAVDRFQNDDTVRLFVGNMKSAGVGLTLTQSAHVLFAEVDHDPSKIIQAEDRCCRLGQTRSVLVQFLLLSGSYDLEIVERFTGRQKSSDLALNPEFVNGLILAPEDLSIDAVRHLIREGEILGVEMCRDVLRRVDVEEGHWAGNLLGLLAKSSSLTLWQRAILSIVAKKTSNS